MLRLWPKSYSVGLFPEHSWVHQPRSQLLHSVEPKLAATSTLGQDLLAAFQALLSAPDLKLSKGSRLDLTVSDCIAKITPIVWQEALQTPEELEAYARICFEKQGMILNEDWVIRVDFQRYQGLGVAYALPSSWLTQLRAIAQQNGVQLRSVLPVSVVAYGQLQSKTLSENHLLLLREGKRITAFIFGEKGLLHIDSEAITSSNKDSSKRLLRRISAMHQINEVSDWSSSTIASTKKMSDVPEIFGDIKTHHLTHHYWG